MPPLLKLSNMFYTTIYNSSDFMYPSSVSSTGRSNT